MVYLSRFAQPTMKRIIICLFFAGLIIIAGIARFTDYPASLFQDKGPRLDYLSAANVSQKAFSSLGNFVSERPGDAMDRHKVVFVGIDGAAWNIIDPMIDDGSLPTFARLKREGCYGVLKSTECYVSPPAWCTMMTGRIPERTGVYTFGQWDRTQKKFLPVQSTDILVPPVWAIVSDAGAKTGVINVPMTYPVSRVNGVLVSGLMTPTQLGDRHTSSLDFRPTGNRTTGDPAYPTYSSELRAVVNFSESRFEFTLLDTTDDRKTNYDHVRLTVAGRNGGQAETDRTQMHVLPLGLFSPWVKFDYSMGETAEKAWCKVRVVNTGREDTPWVAGFSRVLFSTGDTKVTFTYPDSLAEVLQREFGYYFPSKFLDRAIVPEYTRDSARWASYFQTNDDWDLFLYVFTQSDNIQHLEGDSRVTRMVYQTIDNYLARVIAELPPSATLIVASDHGFKGHTYAFDLNKLFEQIGLLTYSANNEIDQDNTLVFHNMWCLYFNRSLLTRTELEKRGVTMLPGEPPRDALIKYLREAGRTLAVGEKRVAFPLEFKTIGPEPTGYAPDMIVEGSYDNYLVEFWNLKRPQQNIVRLLRPDEQWNHTRDGIFMFYGKGIKRGGSTSIADIQDVTPTMLYLLGLPVAMDMEGRVMIQVLDAEELATRTCYLVDTFGPTLRRAAPADEDRESLEKKLKSLGYIHE
jgi:predicted AlkP superfamily phosphohydrolase/phosphomutase